MKTLFQLVLTLVICTGVYAQDSTTVYFLVKGGENYFIRLDGQLLPQTNVQRVSQKPHSLEVWSPKCELYKGTMDNGKLHETSFLVELKQSPSYSQFLSDREHYKKQLFYKQSAPFFVGIVSIATLPLTTYQRSKKHEELVKNQFYEKYNDASKPATQNSKLQYATLNTLFFTSIAAGIISTSVFVAFRKQIKKLEPPIFRQQNPFTLEYIELSMNPTIHSPVAGIALNF